MNKAPHVGQVRYFSWGSWTVRQVLYSQSHLVIAVAPKEPGEFEVYETTCSVDEWYEDEPVL